MAVSVRSSAARLAFACSTIALALVAGCSQPTPPPQALAAKPVVAPPLITPQQPVALSEIHRQAGDVERIWHLRAALNVAALQCVGSKQAGLVQDYNLLLSRHKVVLAQAYAAKQARFQQLSGKGWQKAMDRHMTQLYNHWAWPPAQQRFCANAIEAAHRTAMISPEGFGDYALRALSTVDQPIALTQNSSIRLVTTPTRTAAVSSPAASAVSVKK
jgi:hypothetical protein